MKIPSVNISPRVQCGKTAGKTRVSVTQLNSKLHCRDFVRMSFVQHFCLCRDAWGPGGLPLVLQGVWGGAGVQGARQEPLEGGASPGGGCDCVVNKS